MIRVIYRWTVHPGQAEAFADAWWEATRLIQSSSRGALGSVLLRGQEGSDTLVAIARWESLAAWQASRQPENSVVPDALGGAMRACVTAPATYEILEEMRDWSSQA